MHPARPGPARPGPPPRAGPPPAPHFVAPLTHFVHFPLLVPTLALALADWGPFLVPTLALALADWGPLLVPTLALALADWDPFLVPTLRQCMHCSRWLGAFLGSIFQKNMVLARDL